MRDEIDAVSALERPIGARLQHWREISGAVYLFPRPGCGVPDWEPLYEQLFGDLLDVPFALWDGKQAFREQARRMFPRQPLPPKERRRRAKIRESLIRRNRALAFHRKQEAMRNARRSRMARQKEIFAQHTARPTLLPA